jgi:hypothetical protein
MVEEEIANHVSDKLGRLTSQQKERVAKRYTESGQAYQAFLKGRYHWRSNPYFSLPCNRMYLGLAFMAMQFGRFVANQDYAFGSSPCLCPTHKKRIATARITTMAANSIHLTLSL